MASEAATGTEEQKRVVYYSSHHRILLVGEGDFSFSACLARQFGSARNVVATSLDSQEDLNRKYRDAAANLAELRSLGCKILHGVDAHTMHKDPRILLGSFDRVVYNFPHAGHEYGLFEGSQVLLQKHRALLSGFLWSAARMAAHGGQVHVTHQHGGPYIEWGLEKLAGSAEMVLDEMKLFRADMYPGYRRKRGGSIRADEEFPLKHATYTFMFRLKGNEPNPVLDHSRNATTHAAVTVVNQAAIADLVVSAMEMALAEEIRAVGEVSADNVPIVEQPIVVSLPVKEERDGEAMLPEIPVRVKEGQSELLKQTAKLDNVDDDAVVVDVVNTD